MFKSLVLSRRSTRKFTDEKIDAQFKEELRTCIYFSPSSRNIRPYKIVVVENRDLMEKLSYSKKGAELLKGASLGVVVIGDTSKSDVWVEDCSIIGANIMNLCEDKKLGACWVQIRNRNYSDDKTSDQYVKELLNIPSGYSVECIIAIGKRDFTPVPYSESDVDNDIFFNDMFGVRV